MSQPPHGGRKARAFSSPQHNALRAFLAKKRVDADLTQTALAKKLKQVASSPD